MNQRSMRGDGYRRHQRASLTVCATMRLILIAHGRYVNDGQYIVHEASPTSLRQLEWFTAQ